MQETYLPFLLDVVQNVSQEILAIYHDKNFSVHLKDDHSPVTKADLIADQYIGEKLKALTPAIPVISEESKAASYEERKEWLRINRTFLMN